MPTLIRRLIGLTVKAAATALVILLYISIQYLALSFLGVLMLLPAFAFLGWMFYLADRLLAVSLEEAIRKDWRSPVLFLRPFELDKVRFRRRGLWVQILATLPFPWETARVIPQMTFEEALVSIFQAVGPVIGLGHPTHPLEPVGAARGYASDNWKQRVESLAACASVVVVVPDARPSVVWELQMVAPMLNKVVIVLRPWADSTKRVAAWNSLRNQVLYLPEIDENTAIVSFKYGPRVESATGGSPQRVMRCIRSFVRRELKGRMVDGWVSVLRGVVGAAWVVGVPVLVAIQATPFVEKIDPNIFFALLITTVTLASLTRRLLPGARFLGLKALVNPTRTPNPVRWSLPRLIVIGSLMLIVAFHASGVMHAIGLERFSITSAGMEPTLSIGDRIWAKSIRGTPDHGTVMLVEVGGKKYVKRVIAIGGDTVAIDGTTVFVNGVPIADPEDHTHETAFGGGISYVVHHDASMLALQAFPGSLSSSKGLECDRNACVVQPGYVFVMGDNRENSFDSRHFGAIPMEDLVGRVSIK